MCKENSFVPNISEEEHLLYEEDKLRDVIFENISKLEWISDSTIRGSNDAENYILDLNGVEVSITIVQTGHDRDWEIHSN